MKRGKEVSPMDAEKLYRTYYMDVYSYAVTLLKNADMAEEITQEVFFRALNTHRRFEGRSQELTWLCAIAKNACMDELRRRSRLKPLDEKLPTSVDIAEKLEDKAALMQIHIALHDMDEPYKEVFQLRVFGELSFADIGRIFAKSEVWARVTYHRARLKLRERMGGYE